MEKFKEKPLLIPKHNKGSGEEGILLLYNGPLYYLVRELMKKENPEAYNALLIAVAKNQNPQSEVVMYTDANGTLRSASNTGAGFVSGTDPVGAEVVAGAVLGKPLELAGRAALYGLGRAGNNWARAKLISREMKNVATPNYTYPLNVGWGPKQTIKVTHASNSDEPLQLFFDQRYDAVQGGANPFGVWYLGKWGLPRTAATNSMPGKAEKAEKVRQVFADRKYKHEGEVTLDKPLTTVGEVPSRNALSYEAEKMGADGIVYNNVYDNGFDNNLVIFSFKTPDNVSINITKENAYKLTDQEWDKIYEAALSSGDHKKLKLLRELHFQVKSGNDSQVFAHSTNSTFNQFDKSFFGLTDEGFNGRGFYFTTTRIPENQLIYKIAKGPNGEIPYMNYGRNKKYVYLKGDREYNVGDPNRNFFEEANTVGFVSPKDSKVSEVVVGLPTLIKTTRAITYDDNGNFIPLSKRDDFTNPDIRYFKDAYGREITPTPYPGTDAELLSYMDEAHTNVLKDYFSPEKINLLKSTLGWGDLEIKEFQDELIRSIGYKNNISTQVKGPEDGFVVIGSHKGGLLGTGRTAQGVHSITLNRERIPSAQIALEAVIHELGAHGKTASMKATDFGAGGFTDKMREAFPRMAELVLKNEELANDLLVLNRRGLFFNLFKNIGDLEKYFINNNLSWKDKWDKFYNKFKYFKYTTQPDEKMARAYTGQLYNKVYDPNTKTLNIELLENFYTPESVEAFKKAVLGIAPIATISGAVPSDKKGSKIVIKKKNKGKFTEYCGGEVTNECILKAKKSKNPTLRKRATFALNARGWAKKHLYGGLVP